MAFSVQEGFGEEVVASQVILVGVGTQEVLDGKLPAQGLDLGRIAGGIDDGPGVSLDK
jgi:hypothetical protein